MAARGRSRLRYLLLIHYVQCTGCKKVLGAEATQKWGQPEEIISIFPRLTPAIVLLLVGCAGQYPYPPPAPTITQIGTTWQAIQGSGIPPADYLEIGSTLATANCNSWFSQQVAQAQQRTLATSGVGIGTAAAGLAGGPGGALAAGALGLLGTGIGALQASAPAGGDPSSTYGLVTRMQQAWLAKAPTPISPVDAYMLVESYAELCDLPSIQESVRQAVATASVTARSGAAAFSVRNAGSSSLPARVLPPTVVVGAGP